MVKYPEKIRIGATDFTLKFVETGISNSIDGQYWSSKQEIKISHDLRGQYRASVVLHEVLHGCYSQGSLGDADTLSEEFIVATFSKQLAGVIRDNPQLMKALAADLK